jgi:prepilin-type N-terminal cleavage/methylation domain-containing protein
MARQSGTMEKNMKRERGFSLLELLVAMTVTLIILAATLSLFQTALQTNDSSTQMTTMNGNLRSALNLIVRDLLQAGQGIPNGGVPLPIGSGCKKINRPMPSGTATFPYGCASPASAPNLPAVIPGNALGPAIPGLGGTNLGNPTLTQFPTGGPNSDMVTMLYQDNNLVTNIILVNGQPANNFLQQLTTTSMTFSPAVTVNNQNNGINIGDLFLVYGGGLYRYVVVTATSGQSATFTPSADAFSLNQQATGTSCGTITGTLCDLQGVVSNAFGGTCTYAAGPPVTFTPDAGHPNACSFTAQRVLMVSYFLDAGTIINGQVVPRLMRQVNMTKIPANCNTSTPPAVGCPASVAEVIEGLEFSYDYVTGTPPPITNQVSTPSSPTGITDNQIRKVNVYIAGRSDTLLSPTAQYMRANLATQVDIRSLAFVNRYQ